MSPTSYQTAPSRDNDQMVGEGFEPSKAVPTDLQSAPFGHSGIQPYIFKHLNQNLIMTRCEAVDRTWTGNLLITNQLLCQLSHNGILDDITHLWIAMTPTGFEPVLPPWKGGVLTTWPWSLISDRFTVLILYSVSNSPSRARTSDSTVNSRVLYQLSYRGLL